MDAPFRFAISSAYGAGNAAIRIGATHLLSILDPGVAAPRPAGIAADQHLHLAFRDVDSARVPGAPTIEDVATILRFGAALTSGDALLIHCESGRRRSSAAAFLILVQALGRSRAEEAMDLVVAMRPQAQPNPVVTALGASLLGWPEIVKIASVAAQACLWRRLAADLAGDPMPED